MMKKKWTVLLLLFLFLSLSEGKPVHASSVTYRNQAELFVFVPNSKDLFDNFKGLMPGDVRTQEIFLRNDSRQFVDFFLKINPVKEEDEALLRQMTLVISEEGEEIFRESLDQQGSFENYVKIKELFPESAFSWDLSLEVSKDMGNEFMGKEAEVEWVIMIEEIEDEEVDPLPLPEEPEEPEKPEEPEEEEIDDKELPKTGEQSENYLLYGGGLLALGILVLFLDRKRKGASS